MVDSSEINDFLDKLIDQYSNIQKIWLMGSRLDENTHWKTSPPSDWDLVVFTDKATMNKMKGDLSLRTDDIDLLVVYDEMHYITYCCERADMINREIGKILIG